ncbi:MAG: hypothetical protein RLZ98_1724 [Pseudomonadota bacterium]|jgi:hypothetical protein
MSADKLDEQQLKSAFATVESWLYNRSEPVACVVCDAPGLVIENQSVPPYAEWYKLNCSACGLDTIVSRQTGYARGIDPI